jgi:N-acetylmuramoyl-L-alanine amidase
VICLDAGHGGADPGAISSDGRKESDYTLAQSLIAESYLRSFGHEVRQTRRTDIKVALRDRVDIANAWNADAFVSIHWNASAGGAPNGTQVLHHRDSKRGAALAARLLAEIGPLDGDTTEPWERLIPVPDPSFRDGMLPTVIGETYAPAVILEVEFATNADEAQRLGSDVYRLAVGHGIAVAYGEFKRFLRGEV